MPGSSPLVLAIDQGTSSTKVLAVDVLGRIVATASAPLELLTPQPGWVEHDPREVVNSCAEAIRRAGAQIDMADVVALGISNQRESLVAWDRATGAPLSQVISWQDRRATAKCVELQGAGHGPTVRRVSGLPLDPMFSAAKAAWLIDEVDPARVRSRAGELCIGTIDSWLLWHLSGEHVTEVGNASRTSLLDLQTAQWSPELLSIFDIPIDVLPRIVGSVGHIANVRGFAPLPDGLPITGVLGDSHAALFAHAGWRQGVAKVTFGSGSSIMTVADGARESTGALCRTIAWAMPETPATVAWEANILSAGSTVAWLASILGMTPEACAEQASDDAAGVTIVPAFNGLGAPWWDNDAQALIVGMSLATTRRELARGALDSIVLQVADVVASLADVGIEPSLLVVDGGSSANRDLMQRQADLCGVSVAVSKTQELSALGAAHAAGLGCGVWSIEQLEALPRPYDVIEPTMAQADRSRILHLWHEALARSLSR